MVLKRPEPLAGVGTATPVTLTLPPALLMLVRRRVTQAGGRLHLVKLPLRLWALPAAAGGTAWEMLENPDSDGPDSPDMLPMLRDGKSNTAASEKEGLPAVARLRRPSCCAAVR